MASTDVLSSWDGLLLVALVVTEATLDNMLVAASLTTDEAVLGKFSAAVENWVTLAHDREFTMITFCRRLSRLYCRLHITKCEVFL